MPAAADLPHLGDVSDALWSAVVLSSGNQRLEVSRPAIEHVRPLLEELDSAALNLLDEDESFWPDVLRVKNDVMSFWDSLRRLAFTDFCCRHLGIALAPDEREALEPIMTLARSTHAYACSERACFVFERPVFLKFDAEWQLHADEAPCLSYSDGYEVYAWHGTLVPYHAILQEPTVEMIDAERNVEVRRVLISRFGEERFLLDGGAIKEDCSDFGTLYRREFNNAEPLVMVAVRNHSPEPDGSHRVYYLRVPAFIHTARQAVAWTFDLDEDDYQPVAQT